MNAGARAAVVAAMSLAVSGASAGAAAEPAARPEGILELHAEATVHDDASVTIEETILVWAAGVRIARGIDRMILTRYEDDRAAEPRRRYDLAIADLAVTRDGQPEPFRAESVEGGVRLRIGAGEAPLTPGTHVYVVSYRTRRQLGFSGDRDELLWQVTGPRGELPVEQASAVVRLPEAAAQQMGPLGGWVAPARAGAAATDVAARRGDAAGGAARDAGVIAARRGPAAVFTGTRPLAAGEALVVAVAWPKGVVRAPGRLATALAGAGRPGLLGLAAVTLLFQLVLLAAARVAKLRRLGRAESARAAVAGAGDRAARGGDDGVVREPPQGLSPAALAFAVRGGADPAVLAAALLALAGKGLLTVARGLDGVLVIGRRRREEAGSPSPSPSLARASATADAADSDDDDVDAVDAPTEEERAVLASLFSDGGAGDALRIEAQSGPALAAAGGALAAVLGARLHDRYWVRRSGALVPGLLLTVAGLAALAGVATGTAAARVGAALLAAAIPFWSAATVGVVLACARLAGAAGRRRYGAAVTARLRRGALLAAGFLVVEALALVAFAARASWPAAVLLAAISVAARSLLRAPAQLTAEGEALLAEAEAYRQTLATGSPPSRGGAASLAYAVALDVADRFSARVNARVSAPGEPGPEAPPAPRWYLGGDWTSSSPGQLVAALAAAVSAGAFARRGSRTRRGVVTRAGDV